MRRREPNRCHCGRVISRRARTCREHWLDRQARDWAIAMRESDRPVLEMLERGDRPAVIARKLGITRAGAIQLIARVRRRQQVLAEPALAGAASPVTVVD